jgi:sialidase-1
LTVDFAVAYAQGETPAIVFTGRTLIAFARGTPLVMSRSTDMGRSWDVPRAVPGVKAPSSNPAPVWVAASKTLLFLYGSQGEYFAAESTDEGVSFSAGRKICSDCAIGGELIRKRWGFQLPGPPGGIVASTGRLLQCCDHMHKVTSVCKSAGTPSDCDKGNHVLFSDDKGSTWKVGGLAAQGPPAYGDECSIAQLPGRDVLVMNTRVDSNNNSLTPPGGGRATAFSSDFGVTWGSAVPRPTLPDGTCGGDMIAHDGRDSSLGAGLFVSNVWGGCTGSQCHEFPGTRSNLTLSFSADGIAWEHVLHVWPGNATYSSMVDIGGGKLGMLFDEGAHEKIVFATIQL